MTSKALCHLALSTSPHHLVNCSYLLAVLQHCWLAFWFLTHAKVICASFLFLSHTRSFQLWGFVVIALLKSSFLFFSIFIFFYMGDLFLSFRTFPEVYFSGRYVQTALPSPIHTPISFCLAPFHHLPQFEIILFLYCICPIARW